MESFWQSVAVLFGGVGITWAVLLVVCFACILAFVFEASIDAIFPIFTLSFLTAIAQHVMRNRNGP